MFFTTPHFDGYPAVLARLAPLPADLVGELLLRIWRERAPKRVVKAFLEG
ncbi:MAG: hypothetical protein R3F59_04120 [Myxococcota bacterium]